MKISGEISAADIENGSNLIDERLLASERVSIFAEVDAGAAYTFEGLFKDIVDGLGRINDRKRIYRAALVTDKGWMAAIARVEGIVFSSIDVRVFAPAERDRAFAWASEEPAPVAVEAAASAGLRLIGTTSENIFAYEVVGRLSDGDLKMAVKEFMPLLDKHDSINVLARIKNYDGFDLTSILNDDLYRMKYKALSKVTKYAVVGPKPWMRNFIELVSGIVKTEIRIFDETDEEAAWDWIGGKQASLPA